MTETQSVDSVVKFRPRKRAIKTPKSQDASLSRDDSEDSELLRKSTNIQRVIYFVIISTGVAHFFTFATLLLRRSEVNFILLFHGVLSPSTVLLYIVAVFSGVCGWNALFAKHSRNDPDSAELWFCRYVRMNKYYLLIWFFSTQATIFGCWKFIFAQNMDSTYKITKLSRSTNFDYTVRKIILALPDLLYNVELDYGVKASDPPFNFVQFLGMNSILFLFVISIIPSFMFIAFIWLQHKYYALRFSDYN
jgi:hypothetical protein